MSKEKGTSKPEPYRGGKMMSILPVLSLLLWMWLWLVGAVGAGVVVAVAIAAHAVAVIVITVDSLSMVRTSVSAGPSRLPRV